MSLFGEEEVMAKERVMSGSHHGKKFGSIPDRVY